MAHVLPPLPYAYDALEPYIHARTLRHHHSVHHAAYVDALNATLVDRPDLAVLSVEDLIAHLDHVPPPIRPAVRRNGGAHANHRLFWRIMTPHPLGHPRRAEPTGVLADQIARSFGSLPTFHQQFAAIALADDRAGWDWLSLEPGHGLRVEWTPEEDNPLMAGRTPLLGVDLCPHAYADDYREALRAALADAPPL
jgi:Fe-Mn family superoxide dismutase